MAYIIKNTSGLINTRITDVGRRYMSQGNFNISYFQVGDSEVNYSAVTNYDQTLNNILMPAFNAHNDTGVPQSNKQYIKYPYYLEGQQGATYGIPYMDSSVQPIYNSAGSKGFFNSGGTEIQTTSAYTKTSNYYVDLSTLNGGNSMVIDYDAVVCSPSTGTPEAGDFVTVVADGVGGCGTFSNNAFLTYKIREVSGGGGTYTLTLDRSTPNYSFLGGGSLGRTYIYPSGMTSLYDTVTPEPFWQTDTINFESPCDVVNRENTPIWNMNIPWSESPAGLISSIYKSYEEFGSVSYIGTKEYLGYQESSGQTDTSRVFYNNSFDERIIVSPEEQKTIAIIHYTNQDIDNVYGEKFSTIPFDPQNPTDETGLARHFKLTIPSLMWHKVSGVTTGQTFYIDPPNYELCIPYYIKSNQNPDMNDPGIRYFHLWDTNPDSNNNLNRIGKVFPDQQIVVIDDEEVVAALSYKSNRNWTLPAPKVSLIPPNVCEGDGENVGLLSADTQTLWITYRLDSDQGVTTSLHCNYYSKVIGPSSGCTTTTQDVSIRFGNEFPFLNNTPSSLEGFNAKTMKLIFQLTENNQKPDPAEWLEYDVTSQMTLVGGYIMPSSMTGKTFIITQNVYDSASQYDLSDYLDLPTLGSDSMNFGDEYYFYGNLETDISATIYEMRYLVNLGRNQFTDTSNPTWIKGTKSYISEIGLYNSQKDLMVISKLQSPQLRQGIQQFVVQLDF